MGMFNEIHDGTAYYQTKALGKFGSFGVGDPVEVQCVARTAAEYDLRPAFPYRQLPHEYTIAAVEVDLDRPAAETTDVHFLVRDGRLIGLAGADDVERLPGFDYHGWHPDYEPNLSAPPMPGAAAGTGDGMVPQPGSPEGTALEQALDELTGDDAPDA
ncbi:hypothetical protein K8O93_18795 [Gordonia bronchialis]|uniref:hypothetical protein n=1 Tax=Gordonia bronchialis TaxID=2054 RepID=UPI001CBE4309|nr:hypothetical protein [Gordonia bronchialis]UAK37195.1 hypothetical protein K8O93_18795 [Gordonia bronchialis]